MKIVMPKIYRRDSLFFIAYAVFLISSILATSFYLRYFVDFNKYILLASVLLVMFNEIIRMKKYTLKSLAWMAFLSILSIIILITSSRSVPIICVLVFVYCGRNIAFKSIARFTLLVSAAVVLFIVCSSQLGFIANYATAEGRNRLYLGFRYALYLPAYMFNITAIYVYENGRRIKWYQIGVLLLINIWVYIETNSRLSFFLSLFVLLFAAAAKVFPSLLKKGSIYRPFLLSYVVCLGISLFFVLIYDGSVIWMNDLNTFLGGRLRLGKQALIQYGFNLITGKDVAWVGNGLDIYGQRVVGTYNFVDNLYIQALITYGLLFLVVYLVLHTVALSRCYRQKDYFLLMILVILALHGIIDDLTLQLNYNTFWFVVGTLAINSAPKRGRLKKST